jgi:sodium-dependent dicarboxylate transporter 2/3/5
MSGDTSGPNHLSYRRIGLISGIVLAAALSLAPAPSGMTPEAQRVAAIAALMGCWWISEAIPIAATSLVPLAFFPLFGVMKSDEVASCYGDSTIFLFAGGFFIAMAMQKWGLHKRIALRIIRRTGTNPSRLVLGFMIASAFLSLWVSNAATTMMMLPIGVAVLDHFDGTRDERARNFGVCITLGIAYAASIGGVGTLIGTPPNIVLAGVLDRMFPGAPEIGFGQWMLFGMPFVIVFIPTAWFVLAKIIYPVGDAADAALGREAIDEQIALLGPMKRGEVVVLAVSCLTALAWIFRTDLKLGAYEIPGWTSTIPNGGYINDGAIAIGFALLLFLMPVDRATGERALDWEWAQRIPWGVLLLFGGGFAVAEGFETTGLARWFGDRIGVLSGAPLLVTVVVVAVGMTFLTEFMSNTALTTIMLPVLGVAATTGLQVHPLVLMVPATISASLAFMLPAGTPPNALVYGSGRVSIAQMVRGGLVLNLIGVILVTIVVYVLIIPLLGITPGRLPEWAL